MTHSDIEAQRRAEFLNAHKAPSDWVILTIDETRAMKAEVDAAKAELVTAQQTVSRYTEANQLLGVEVLRLQKSASFLRKHAEDMGTEVLSLYTGLKVERAEMPSHDPRLPLQDKVIAELAKILGVEVEPPSIAANPLPEVLP